MSWFFAVDNKTLDRTPGNRLAPRSERLARLAKLAQQQLREGTPANTVRAYEGDWARFQSWCAELALQALPADIKTITLYVAYLADENRPAGRRHRAGACRPPTIERALAAISYMHRVSGFPTPTTSQTVKDHLKALRIATLKQKVRAAPLLRVDLEAMVALFDPTNLVHVRDRAILLVGWACALRRSEIVSLHREDIEQQRQGLLVSIRKSKGNQTGEPELLPVEHAKNKALCPVLALQKWLVLSGIVEGSLFCNVSEAQATKHPMHDWQVDALVKRWTTVAKLSEPSRGYRYSAHSLRAGFITQAIKDGRPEWAVMHHARHRDYKTMQNYIRLADPFKDNPCKGLL